MKPDRFVGRERELDRIRSELDRDRSSLIVLYGRRRVGKSTLIARATADRPTIYYQATEVVGSLNLALLKKEVASHAAEQDPVLDGIETWEALLTYVGRLARDERGGLTLVLDEFPYICEAVEGLPSVVQKIWDRSRQQTDDLNIVLCGSSIAFMEELLGEKNPLRGRHTLQIELEPLSFREAGEFFPDWSATDRSRAYGVFGGMPHYLDLCRPESTLAENLRDVILEPGAPLHSEPDSVLQAELTSPTRYATVLQAIADGCTTTGEILGRTREIADASALAPYIQRLEALRLIRVTRSLDAAPKARNRRYELADPFLAFWYRFCLPNRSALTRGHAGDVYHHLIAPGLSDYMGEVFEWIAREYVSRYGVERLGVAAQQVGKIWGDAFDIDVAGRLLDGTVLFGECKWWSSPVGANVLRDLRADAGRTVYGDDADRVRYLLFSRSGFTEELQEEATQKSHVHLFDPATLLGLERVGDTP